MRWRLPRPAGTYWRLDRRRRTRPNSTDFTPSASGGGSPWSPAVCPASLAGIASSERSYPRAGSANLSLSDIRTLVRTRRTIGKSRRAIDLVGWLFDMVPAATYAQGVGKKKAGPPSHLSMSLTYPNGAAALVSLGSPAGSPASPTLMVLGRRGALYDNQTSTSQIVLAGGQATPLTPEVDDPFDTWLEYVSDSIRSGIVAGDWPDGRLSAGATWDDPCFAGQWIRPKERSVSARTYRVALLSNAMHQDMYARAFDLHPRFEVAVVAEEPGREVVIEERGRRLAKDFKVPHTTDVRAVLERPDIDVVSVCAEIERRGRLAEMVARSGKHLWMDKPLAPTLDQCDAIVAAARRNWDAQPGVQPPGIRLRPDGA